MTRTMRAAVVRGPQKFEVAELPLPEPEPGEVRVRIEACGVCGSDLHFYRDNLMPPGHTPGHEMVGVVDALGSGVTAVTEGARVAVEPMRTCGECVYCASGRDNLCRRFQIHGVHLSGGFAEHVVVGEQRVFPVPAELSPAVAAMTEPFAFAVHGLRRGRFEQGGRVLVLGAGAVGLVTLLVARALHAREVWVTARYPHQAEQARALGAARVLTEQEATPEALGVLGLETDFDIAVETVGGRANTLEAAIAAIRPGGTVSVLGLFTSPPAVNPLAMLLKEGTLAWSNCYSRSEPTGPDFADAVRLVDSEREQLEGLATHQLPLDEIGRAFELASDKSAGTIKVSVLPERG